MGIQKFGKRPMLKVQDRNYLTTASTGTPMQAGGVYLLSSTASLKNHTLAAPIASQVGMTVVLHCIKATTNLIAKVTLTNASLYSTVSSTATTKDTIRFNRADMSATLRAISTAKWKAEVLVNSPTITTS